MYLPNMRKFSYLEYARWQKLARLGNGSAMWLWKIWELCKFQVNFFYILAYTTREVEEYDNEHSLSSMGPISLPFMNR